MYMANLCMYNKIIKLTYFGWFGNLNVLIVWQINLTTLQNTVDTKWLHDCNNPINKKVITILNYFSILELICIDMQTCLYTHTQRLTFKVKTLNPQNNDVTRRIPLVPIRYQTWWHHYTFFITWRLHLTVTEWNRNVEIHLFTSLLYSLPWYQNWHCHISNQKATFLQNILLLIK